MPATEQTGTALDFVTAIANNHYLPTAGSDLSPADDTELAWVVFDGPGDEDYVVEAYPDSNRLGVAVGYNANTSSQSTGGTFNDGQIHNAAYDRFPGSYDDPMRWWYYSGPDWTWFAAFTDLNVNGQGKDVFGLGWQAVTQYWNYYETYDSARVAMFLDSQRESDYQGRGWGAERGAGMAKIDSEQIRSQNNNPLRWQQQTQPLLGGVTEANTWRATDKTVILKGADRQQLAGTINAWGYDLQKSSVIPAHLDEFDAGGRSYQYIRPVQNSWAHQPPFFRTA